MNNTFIGFITNKYIYIPFLLWFGIQLFKLIYDLVTTKKFNFKRIIGAGGMPSSHSAVVMSLINWKKLWSRFSNFCTFNNHCFCSNV